MGDEEERREDLDVQAGDIAVACASKRRQIRKSIIWQKLLLSQAVDLILASVSCWGCGMSITAGLIEGQHLLIWASSVYIRLRYLRISIHLISFIISARGRSGNGH